MNLINYTCVRLHERTCECLHERTCERLHERTCERYAMILIFDVFLNVNKLCLKQ